MHPPRLAQLVVAAFVREPEREFLLGDLEEQFAQWRIRRGRFGAWAKYWRQALAGAWHARGVGRIPGNTPKRGRVDMSNFWRELKLSVRTAWKSPAYSAVVILTMALAIGANTLLFSIANPLVLRPLPIKDPNSMGWIWEQNTATGDDRGRVSIADLLDWRAGTKTFSSLAGFQAGGGTLTGLGDAERVQLMKVTGNLADVWGLRPVAGRVLQAGDDVPGRPLVGVLANRYWKGPKFNGDPGVIGKTFFLNGKPITIAGIMQPEIEFGSIMEADIWVPLVLDPSAPRDERTVRVMGRLASGARLTDADAEIRALSANQERDHAATNRGWRAHVVPTKAAITSADTWVLLGLLGVVVLFVLVIACANLANLVLARVVARRQDLAVRQALGASRLQVIRPLVLENIVLGVVGGVAGLGLAHGGLRVINAVAFDNLLRTLSIDGNVLVFTAILSLVTPILFSLWPALGAGRADTANALREARTSGTRRTGRSRNILVVAQVALALSLLVMSGLVIRTMRAYEQIRVGLDVPHLVTFKLELPSDVYPDAGARARFADAAAQNVAAIPGVTAAAAISRLPVFDAEVVKTITGTRHDGATDKDRAQVCSFAATPAFFEAAGIHLLAGRPFAPGDVATSQPVAIVNRMAAEKYFDRLDDAVGRTVNVVDGGLSRPIAIVGVVEDTRDTSATRTSPQLYVPFSQAPVEAMTIVARSDDPGARSNDIRVTMRRIAPAVAITTPQTMQETAIRAMGDGGIVTGLFTGFAVLALALAAAGLYGVISYSVGQRRREIGVRLALGAAPAMMRRMVLMDGLKVTGIGMVSCSRRSWARRRHPCSTASARTTRRHSRSSP
jgi:predicted permease